VDVTGTRADFLSLARSTGHLLRAPQVTTAWTRPSALPELRVGDLAGHLAYQILVVPPALAGPAATEPTVALLEHFARVRWIGAGIDDDISVRIRRDAAEVGAEGPAALSARVSAAVEQLARDLPAAPDGPVHLPLWGGWSTTLDDMLVTRMVELAVHCDDLAVSVGVETPTLAPGAVTAVLDVLTRLAVRRHGAVAVLRALSRAERAPATIAAL
jgi:hypothetical protein